MSKEDTVSDKPSDTSAQSSRPVDETQKLPALEAGQPSVDLELEKLVQERDEFKTQYLRSLAEFDNYQKRTKREMERFREDATRDLLKDLVLVLDSLDMTVGAAKQPGGTPDGVLASVGKAVELAREQLLRVVSLRGLVPIGAKPGDPFDPEKHEAVMAVPTPGIARDEVGLVAREGYKLGSTVLRPASVQVKKADGGSGS
jgi:molecular chaperone GrpE